MKKIDCAEYSQEPARGWFQHLMDPDQMDEWFDRLNAVFDCGPEDEGTTLYWTAHTFYSGVVAVTRYDHPARGMAVAICDLIWGAFSSIEAEDDE